MNPILVIGATGTVGRQVVSRLAATGTQVRAVARNPGAARLPRQVEVVCGDLTLPETLDGCFDGIDTVFLVWTAPPASAEGCPSLFGWFTGITAQSDFSCTFASAARFMAFADRS